MRPTYPAPKCATFPEKQTDKQTNTVISMQQNCRSREQTERGRCRRELGITVELDELGGGEEGDGGEAHPEEDLDRPPLRVPRVPAVVHFPRVHRRQEHHEEEELITPVPSRPTITYICTVYNWIRFSHPGAWFARKTEFARNKDTKHPRLIRSTPSAPRQ